MKKLLFVFLVAIACTGCIKTESEMIADIKNKFPDAEIRKIPTTDTQDHWIIKTHDNKIVYITYDACNNLVEYSMF